MTNEINPIELMKSMFDGLESIEQKNDPKSMPNYAIFHARFADGSLVKVAVAPIREEIIHGLPRLWGHLALGIMRGRISLLTSKQQEVSIQI